jgi:hypothetical protein
MTFTQWYEKTHRDWWHEDYASLYRFADEMASEYKDWCKENNVKPIWNG